MASFSNKNKTALENQCTTFSKSRCTSQKKSVSRQPVKIVYSNLAHFVLYYKLQLCSTMTTLHLNHVMFSKESSKHLFMTPTRWQRGDPYIHRFPVMTTFWNTDPGSARIDLRMLVQWIHHMQKSTRTHPKQHPEIQEAAPSSLIVLGTQRVSVSSNVISVLSDPAF